MKRFLSQVPMIGEHIVTSQEIMSTLQREVGEWSLTNFGDQASKTHVPLVLGSVAPVLGIVEEFGEMMDAMCNNDITLVKDSVADVLVYLADFYARVALDAGNLISWSWVDAKLQIECNASTRESTAVFILKRLGWFAHVNLKRHQGIRGYEVETRYREEIAYVTDDLLAGLGRLYSCAKRDYFIKITVNPSQDDIWTYSAVTSEELLNLAWLEWQNVKQRNWKTNAVTG